MVRPFEGFMAEDGTVYDTEQQCEAYEATFDLHASIRNQEMVNALDVMAQNYIITTAVAFIRDHRDVILRYLRAETTENTIMLPKDLFEHGKDELRKLSADGR
jgi:hypothetical protein